MRRILIVVHQTTSNPGLVGQILEEAGYTLEICCPAIGHALPDRLDGHAGAIVFGGPMSANDDTSLPFIRAELDWIPIVLEANKPFLGICLGAQMLTRVLGAAVTPHPDDLREIGYAPIQPTLNSHNPFAQLTHVYHWHKEGFELPQDAVLLATGEVFPHQAFRYGETAYGVQFHPEITREMIDLWTTNVPEQLILPGAQPYDKQIRDHTAHAANVESWLREFLYQWLNSALMPQVRLADKSRAYPSRG
ncbi:MAG: glutamine amidotransferase [Cyanobacteria bacterium CRU_2_1]|nr:glutamine amidotransferase [Cyanobacteria bacterium RU_5_0]NJR62355.1 glutamine amidotransferase [Cyanobacteria bacterium CRU_2_1]